MAEFLHRAWLERPALQAWLWFGLSYEHGYQQRALVVDFPECVQARIERALESVASRMPKPIALPPWHRQNHDPPAPDPFDDVAGQEWYEEPDEEWRIRLDQDPDWPVVLPPRRRRVPDAPVDVAVATSQAPRLAEPPIDTSRAASRTRQRISPIAAIRVGEMLVQELGEGVCLEDLRALIRRGRPARADDELRRQLATAIARLRAQRRVRVAALAIALACDPATIWRQIQRANRVDHTDRAERP